LKRVTIQFPADRSPTYYTRVWYLAEDLYRLIVTPELGTMNDIYRGREVIWMDVKRTSDPGTVRAILKKQLRRHFPDGDATVILTR
jgi:hypothetical protein